MRLVIFKPLAIVFISCSDAGVVISGTLVADFVKVFSNK